MKNNDATVRLFEKAPVMQAIAKLALPTVLGQMILVIYNMADTFFVGMTGRDEMLTAVTVCMPVYMVLSAIANLFGVGGASSISRSLGMKDEDRAHEASSFAFWGCMLLTAFYSLLVYLLVSPILMTFGGADERVYGLAKDYLIVTVVIGGLPTALNSFLAHLLRAEGKALHASFGVALGGVMNIVLDPLFMFALLPEGNEVLGAAIATTLSNLIAVLYYAVVLFRRRRKTVLCFSWPKALHGDLVRDVMLTGLPACAMTVMENLSYALMESLIAAYGLAAQTGLGVAKKINMLAHCVTRGMTQGVLPLIGYNYSAKNYRRMRSVLFSSAALSVLAALLLMLLNIHFGNFFVGIFIRSESDALAEGVKYLTVLCIGGPFSAFAYTVISYFQAVGQSARSFVLALLRKGITDIPLMYLMNLLLRELGVVLATPIADVLCCLVSVLLITRFLKKLEQPAAARSC